MTLIKSTDLEEGQKFNDTHWDNNVEEIDVRLVAALTAAQNAVLIRHNVSSEAQMLALTVAKVGHFARRTDQKAYYLLLSADATDIANWLFICYYDGLLTENDRPKNTDVANTTERDALNATAKRGDTCRVLSNVSVYQWNGSTWIFMGYYQIGSSQITGGLAQSQIINLIGDLGYLDGRIAVLEANGPGLKQYRYVLRYSELITGVPGTSNTRNIFPLEPHTVIHAVKVFTKEAWTSGTNSVFNTRVFYDTTDLVTSGNSTAIDTQRVSNTMVACAPAGGDAVQLEVTCDSDITDWTAGKIMVFLYYTQNNITES